MKLYSLVLALALSALANALVCAQVGAQTAEIVREAKTPSPDPGRFSVGAGLGLYYEFGGTGLSSLSLLSSSRVTTSSVTPFGTALFEWAASRNLRVMTGASGSYAKQLHIKGEARTGAPISIWTAGLGIGLRWVVNPGQLVEFSPALLLGVHGGKSNDEVRSDGMNEPHIDTASVGTDARLGFVLEHALLPQLYLRFEAYLLRGGVTWAASRTDTGRDRHAQADLGWGISPMLQLRLTL